MSDTLLILNAKIVNENTVFDGDIYVRNGRIDKISKDLSSLKVQQVLDIKGKYLLPGIIDDQVHFQDSKISEKGSICTESQAAVAGGITTFFDMPNTSSKVLDSDALEEKMKQASEKSIANYSFYHGTSHDNLEAIKAINPRACCGLKVFMGASTDNMLVDDEETLDSIFQHAPLLVATHCEDTPIIVENEENYRQIYGDEIPFELHPKIRSEEACYKSSSLAIELAKAHDTRLHLLHITTAKEAEMLSDLPINEKRITAEVCSHYLTFCEEDYAEKGGLIKCNPAIKTAVDRASLFQGLLDGRLDIIGSDHVPHTLDEKQGNYFQTPSGVPLAQYLMPSLLEHYQDGIISLEFIVEKTSHAVADLFEIKDRGYIREGYWADFVVIDTETKHMASNKEAISKCAWTPFDGYNFRSTVFATIVNGSLVFVNNKVRKGTHGKRVKFNREKLS